MKGLKLNFTDAGVEIDLTTPVADFGCEVQNALVDIGIMRGSSRIYPAQGTNLLRNALSGSLIDIAAAGHASNFAALSALTFSRNNDYADTANPLVGVTLKPATFSGLLLKLDAQFTAADGTVSGVITNLA